MKIIKTLFFPCLALTLLLASFNVYAADQSICNPGSRLELYENGSLKACQLKDSYDANEVQCKSDGFVSFHKNGNIESCVLSAEATIGGNKCKQDGLVSFYSDGKLMSCVKPDN